MGADLLDELPATFTGIRERNPQGFVRRHRRSLLPSLGRFPRHELETFSSGGVGLRKKPALVLDELQGVHHHRFPNPRLSPCPPTSSRVSIRLQEGRPLRLSG